MHLFDTLSLLARRWWLVLVIGLVVAVLALVVQALRPAVFVAETTVSIARVNRVETPDFQYDNFYSVEAAEMVVNTASRYFEAADFAQAVALRGGTELADADALDFARQFKVKQVSPHLLSIRVTSNDSEDSRALLNASLEELSDRLSNLELAEARKGTEARPAFAATSADPVVYERTYSSGVVFGAGLLAGLFLGLAIVVLETALRTSPQYQKTKAA